MAVGEAIAQLPEDFQQVNLLRMDGHDGDTQDRNPGQEEPFPHGCACIAFSMGAERCQGTQDGKNRSHTGVMVPTMRNQRPSIRHRNLGGPCRPPGLLGARGRYRTWTTHP